MDKTNAKAPKKIDKENVLMVEGQDEKNFFEALLKTFEKNEVVQVIDVGGKDKFNSVFPVLWNNKTVEIKNIGFVRDAEDKKAVDAFQSICNIIAKHDVLIPDEPCRIVKQGGKRVGIFIMPNNNDCGMLEDLCLISVQDTYIYQCVECFVKSYTDKIDDKRYNLAKAKTLAYLSTQVPIVNSLGLASQQKVWNFENPCFSGINSFLKELFD